MTTTHRILALTGALAAPLLSAAPVLADADVQVFNVIGVTKWGSAGGITAYSFGSDMCNAGDADLPFEATSQHHPLIVENLYRARDGRFEQIGMSWAWHSFSALAQGACGSCNGHSGSVLGAGCNSSDTASAIGQQAMLGPRSEVDGFSGLFAYPFATRGQSGPVLFKRLQVVNEDLNPATNPGATYYAEILVVTPDDAGTLHSANNAGARRVVVGPLSGGGYTLTTSGATSVGIPAIVAWAAADASVALHTIDVPGDGRFYVVSHVADLGAGRWRYDYAVFNHNSSRAAAALRLPAPGAVLSDIRFHDVAYHSGELYSDLDWLATFSGGELAWRAQAIEPAELGNALRWATAYSFSFIADRPPTRGPVALDLFAAGDPASVSADGFDVPAPRYVSGDANCDGLVDNGDIDAFVLAISDAGQYEIAYPACRLANADTNRDGLVDNGDIDAFVACLIGGGCD